MAQIDIQREIKAASLKLQKLEEVNETYLKLKNKYDKLEIFYDEDINKYNFYLNNNNIRTNDNYNFEYSVYWDGLDRSKSLYLKKNIVDKEYKVTIYTYYDLMILQVFYRSNEMHIWNYYYLPNSAISKIESSLIDELKENKLKIINEAQSEKVQRFIDNLIFM